MPEENINIWDIEDNSIENIIPFFKWENSEIILTLDKPITDYKVKQITGQYGTNNYIELVCDNVLSLFKIDSVRLRTALKSVKPKKYPVDLCLIRSGFGFNTKYELK